MILLLSLLMYNLVVADIDVAKLRKVSRKTSSVLDSAQILSELKSNEVTNVYHYSNVHISSFIIILHTADI